MSKVNIAVIGAGWWCTEFHLPYLNSLENVNLYSVCRFGNSELNLVKEKFDDLGILEFASLPSDGDIDWADLSRPLFEESA